MAIIRCSECGRAVSDKAAHCVGCGAPTAAPPPGFDWLPNRDVSPPMSFRQLWWRGLLAAAMLVIGAVWAGSLDRHPGANRVAATLAALLLITGLCWFVVTLLQGVGSRRQP